MMEQRRLMMALGAAAGGIAAAAFLHAPPANALPPVLDDCDKGLCQLLSGGPENPENYYGFRPVFEQWVGDQPINVTVGTGSQAAIEGSYNVAENDISTPYLDEATYQFGDFTPAAGNTAGIDGDLSGATVYDMVLGPGGKTVDGMTTFDFQNFNVFLGNGDHVWVLNDPGVFTTYIESTPTDSGAWFTLGDSTTPTLIYDTLTNPSFPTEVFDLGNYMPYDYWLPVFDSMFPPGLT